MQSNRPVHEIRHRNLRAAIWKNQTEKGAMYDVHVTRGFRDGEKWRDSHSFGYDDLMNVAKLLFDAHSFIAAAYATQLRVIASTATARAPKQRPRRSYSSQA